MGCAGLLAVFCLLAWMGVRFKSATYDEPLHGAAGYAILTRRDYRTDMEDPPLVLIWSALPNVVAPPVRWPKEMPWWDGMLTEHRLEWQHTRQLLYGTPGNDPDAFLARGRAMMLLLGLSAGVLMAWWSWRLGGSVAGVAATLFYALDPNFLGHAPLVKNDVPFALMLLATSWCLWMIGRGVTPGRVAAGGALCGLMLLTKFSGVIAVALVVILLGVRALLPEQWSAWRWTAQTRRQKSLVAACVTLAIGLIAYAVVWAGYGFRYSPVPADVALDHQAFRERYLHRVWLSQQAVRGLPMDQADESAWKREVFSRSRIVWLMNGIDRWRLLPQAWTCGFLYTYATTMGRYSFLMGEYSTRGWWYYFPLAMLFKTPTATLAAVLLGVPLVGLMEWARRRRVVTDSSAKMNPPGKRPMAPAAAPTEKMASASLSWWDLACLAGPFALYGLMSLVSNMNIGFRHVLALYPFLFMAVGLAAARVMGRWPTVVRWTLIGLGLGLAVETALAYPNFIAFFNAPSGGSSGGLRLLSDSNLDWGQDLSRVARWRRENPYGTLLYAYFGSADPDYYNLGHYDLPGTSVASGRQIDPATATAPVYLAVHATVLQGTYLQQPHLAAERAMYRALRERVPDAVLGGTVYIYRVR